MQRPCNLLVDKVYELAIGSRYFPNRNFPAHVWLFVVQQVLLTGETEVKRATLHQNKHVWWYSDPEKVDDQLQLSTQCQMIIIYQECPCFNQSKLSGGLGFEFPVRILEGTTSSAKQGLIGFKIRLQPPN